MLIDINMFRLYILKIKLCKVFINEVIIFDNIVKMVFLIRGFDDYSLYL